MRKNEKKTKKMAFTHWGDQAFFSLKKTLAQMLLVKNNVLFIPNSICALLNCLTKNKILDINV